MKTKKLLSFLVGTFLFSNFAIAAFDHGSLIVKNTPLYEQRDGAVAGTPVAGQTLSFKLVTIGNKTWAWTELYGSTIQGEAWSSQLRWWKGTNKNTDKTENNLTGRISETQQTYGFTTNVPAINPITVTIFQHIPGEWVFRETNDFAYNYTAKNSASGSDVTAPVLANPTISSQTSTAVTLNLSATEASGDYFYYITDATNNFAEVVFTNTTTLALNQGTNYSFSIYAVDFSGNTSDAKTINVTGQTFQCNNLLASKTLSLGTVYFSPGWTASTNYTASVVNNDITLNLTAATGESWQAQFPIMVATPVTVTPGQTYSLVLNANLTKNTPVYVKFFDANDNQFMDIPKKTVNAGNNVLNRYDIVCPAGLTQISKILFDFGGNPADAGITITDLSICGNTGTGLNDNVASDKISISQLKTEVTISSENDIKAVSLFSVTGQFIPVELQNNSISTINLSKGLYLMTVTDILGQYSTFKIMIK